MKKLVLGLGLLFFVTVQPALPLQCYQCNSLKNDACKLEITSSSTIPVNSCSFGIGTHCAVISYRNPDGVFYVERDCLPTNTDCNALEKSLNVRLGPLEGFSCRVCTESECNTQEVVEEEEDNGSHSSEKIYVFVYMFFLFVLIGIAALFEY